MIIYPLDFETTGLDPKKDHILDVSLLRLDTDTGDLTTLVDSLTIDPPAGGLARMCPYVRDMHTETGLMDKLSRGEGVSVHVAEAVLMSQMPVMPGCPNGGPLLLGMSIHFDRSFIAEKMTDLHSQLSHRMIDVSSIKRMAEVYNSEAIETWGEYRNSRPHNSYHDCLEAVACFQHFGQYMQG